MYELKDNNLVKLESYSTCLRVNTYQGLSLKQRCISIVNKDRPDAEEQQLAQPVEQRKKVGVVDVVAIAIPHPFDCLV